MDDMYFLLNMLFRGFSAMVNQCGIEVDLKKPSIDRQDVELKGGEVREKKQLSTIFFCVVKRRVFFLSFFFEEKQ